jgi:hypothetical protein
LRPTASECPAGGLTIDGLLDSVDDGAAPLEMGGYKRGNVAEHEGYFITICPVYLNPKKLKTYLTRIYWEHAESCLKFEELKRVDSQYAHRGYVYVPHSSTRLFLMTIERGWVRVVSVRVADGHRQRGNHGCRSVSR